MIDHDSTFLADLTGFLDGCEVSVEPHGPDITTNLLLESGQLLAETEALLHGSVDILDPAVPNTHTATKQHGAIKAAKRRIKCRTNRQNERQTLEEEERHLSEELEGLQRARKRAKALGGITLVTSACRAIAIRQMEGRLVAEEQQRRLQNAVASRAEVIEELGQMIRERVDGWQKSTMMNIEMETQCSVQLDADDTVLFEEFLHDLDVVYPRTDEVFQACGVEEQPASSYRLEPGRKRDGDVEYLDNLDVMLIPFSFKQTGDTMWQSMLRLYRQKNWYHYDVIDPENILAAKAHVHVSRESGDRVRMLVHFVMRRYVEAERMIVVWRALSEGEGEFNGMHSDETGWCVVRPNNSDEPLLRTIMQTFVRFIPMDTTNASNGTVDGYQFTKLVVMSVEEDSAEVARMMDSLLLEDSLDKDDE